MILGYGNCSTACSYWYPESLETSGDGEDVCQDVENNNCYQLTENGGIYGYTAASCSNSDDHSLCSKSETGINAIYCYCHVTLDFFMFIC